MKITVGGVGNHGHIPVMARCPHCGKEAVMHPIGQHDYSVGGKVVCGQRKCPNPNCNGHLFVVLDSTNLKLLTSYPPVRIDFDPENIPANVLETFQEAITCHSAGCFIAAAIMVRRTLEEICADRNASGKNLKDRLTNLGTQIVLPRELIEAMDELRLLGNDAAHLEAKEYESVSEQELCVAVEFTKEILKGIYQYSSLLSKLRALKKS